MAGTWANYLASTSVFVSIKWGCATYLKEQLCWLENMDGKHLTIPSPWVAIVATAFALLSSSFSCTSSSCDA